MLAQLGIVRQSGAEERGFKKSSLVNVRTGGLRRVDSQFAHLKRILRLGRLRLRGPRGAQDEFVLAAIAQNLRRLAVLIARPPPTQALCFA